MRLIRLVFNDLRKDALWILLFGIVISLTFIHLYIFIRSYASIRAANIVLHKLEEKNVWFSDPYDLLWTGNDQKENMAGRNPEMLLEYVKENFNHDGVGGFSLDIGSSPVIPVPQYYLVGRMTELTSYPYDPSDGIRVMAKKNVRDRLGESITLGGKVYPVELAPDEFSVFERYGSTLQGDHIYIFCPDYEDYVIVGNGGLASGIPLMESILVRPDEEDIRQFRRMTLEGLGLYGTLESIEHYLATTDQKGERTHLLYVIFYTTAAAALVSGMVINLVRLMQRKFQDYAVHHLYGENHGHIYARMSLYASGYQMPALLLFLLLMGGNRLLDIGLIIGSIGSVLVISLTVSSFLYREFKDNLVTCLRRKED